MIHCTGVESAEIDKQLVSSDKMSGYKAQRVLTLCCVSAFV